MGQWGRFILSHIDNTLTSFYLRRQGQRIVNANPLPLTSVFFQSLHVIPCTRFDFTFIPALSRKVATPTSYYVNMMIAWYFATALARQYDTMLPYVEDKRLDDWCHNMTIRKCVESYLISKDLKDYLRTFRIKKR